MPGKRVRMCEDTVQGERYACDSHKRFRRSGQPGTIEQEENISLSLAGSQMGSFNQYRWFQQGPQPVAETMGPANVPPPHQYEGHRRQVSDGCITVSELEASLQELRSLAVGVRTIMYPNHAVAIPAGVPAQPSYEETWRRYSRVTQFEFAALVQELESSADDIRTVIRLDHSMEGWEQAIFSPAGFSLSPNPYQLRHRYSLLRQSELEALLQELESLAGDIRILLRTKIIVEASSHANPYL